MFSESARFYDAIYSEIKDYRGESQRLADLIRAQRPHATRLLDVGCGTGEHARFLAAMGFQVDGLDREAAFVERARTKNPEGRFSLADMVDFALESRYDVVTCLFSSIGYVRTVSNLRRTLKLFARHLNTAGLVIVEPWFQPGEMTHGAVYLHTAEQLGLKVCRMSHTEVRGRVSRLQFEYLIGDSGGLKRASEVHELGLFTRAEMQDAFRRAGLSVEYDPEGLSGRGLYVGCGRSGAS